MLPIPLAGILSQTTHALPLDAAEAFPLGLPSTQSKLSSRLPHMQPKPSSRSRSLIRTCSPPLCIRRSHKTPSSPSHAAKAFLPLARTRRTADGSSARRRRPPLPLVSPAFDFTNIGARLPPSCLSDVRLHEHRCSTSSLLSLRRSTSRTQGIVGSSNISTAPPSKISKMAPTVVTQPISSETICFLEFDGASKGNPGKAGAGAILRTEDGNVVSRVREGLGIATNNVAEYRALILGMKYALMRGFKHIRVKGDSQLVCMQVQDLWQTKNQNMSDLCNEAKKLKDMFLSFRILHVRREFNTFADNLANLAITLQVGEVCEDYDPLSESGD